MLLTALSSLVRLLRQLNDVKHRRKVALTAKLANAISYEDWKAAAGEHILMPAK